MNLENDSQQIWQKTGSWPIEVVGDDVALVRDLLVGDDMIEGEDAVVGKGVASILDRFNQISENNERKDN